MAENEDRRRILDMLAAGSISVDEASNLLKALGGNQAPPQVKQLAGPVRTSGPVRMLRIRIDEGSGEEGSPGTRVRVNVPLALARFAARFLPAEASKGLTEQGIDLAEIISSLGDELPDGRLVDIDATNEEEGNKTTRIIVEVV